MWKANVLSPINSTHFLRASIVQSPLHKPPETALSSRFLLRARASKERLGGALAIFLPLVIPGPSCGECDSVGRPSSSGLSLRWPSHKIDRDALWSCWLFSVIDIPSICWWFFIFLMKFRTGKKKERKKRVYTAASVCIHVLGTGDKWLSWQAEWRGFAIEKYEYFALKSVPFRVMFVHCGWESLLSKPCFSFLF